MKCSKLISTNDFDLISLHFAQLQDKKNDQILNFLKVHLRLLLQLHFISVAVLTKSSNDIEAKLIQSWWLRAINQIWSNSQSILSNNYINLTNNENCWLVSLNSVILSLQKTMLLQARIEGRTQRKCIYFVDYFLSTWTFEEQKIGFNS